MDFPVADSRHLRGPAATIAVTWTDQHGDNAVAGGAVTVGVARADGTALIAPGSATTGANPYTRTVTPTQTALLDVLAATWTDAGTGVVRTTLHEIAGAYYFSEAELRALDPELVDDAVYPVAKIRAARLEAEDECENICAQAFVPRYRRVAINGRGDRELQLPDPLIRSVRSVRVYANPTTYTTFTSDDLAALVPYDDGRLLRPAGSVYDPGDNNVVVEYEHGHDRPPRELQHAVMTRTRHILNREKTGIPDIAETFTSTEGGTFKLMQPSKYKTGIPAVDAVYARFSRRETGVVSRTFDYDPTRNTVFHGGRR